MSRMRTNRMDLSIVIPIKDERDNLIGLHERITQALDPFTPALSPAAGERGKPAAKLRSYEIILVDDGSSDGSLAVLRDLAGRDDRVKVICLKRNFGQSAALQAGLDAAEGDLIATMDGDLQNDPADLPMLLDKLDEGYD